MTLEGLPPTLKHTPPLHSPVLCPRHAFSVLVVCPVSLQTGQLPPDGSLPLSSGQTRAESTVTCYVLREELVEGIGEVFLTFVVISPRMAQKHLKNKQDKCPASLKCTPLAIWHQPLRGPHDGLEGRQAKAAGLPGSARSAHMLHPRERTSACVNSFPLQLD